MTSFHELFGPKPIIGMLHLAGGVERAVEEARTYEDCGVRAAIVENYHGSVLEVASALERLTGSSLVLGVNVLPNEFYLAFGIAHNYGGRFIQLDHVAGKYRQGTLPVRFYERIRAEFPDILVLGGVHPKYYAPLHPERLPEDLETGARRADAIVVTGSGTGSETPMGKISYFRTQIGDHPLVVGAGLTPRNAAEQLAVADGAIVGSYFKDSDTRRKIIPERVRELERVVSGLR